MDYASLSRRVAGAFLEILGGFHPEKGEKLGQTLILLGPLEPDFWFHFKASAEYRDGLADPMDRWSERVIGAFAQDLGGAAHFPFGGPPYMPFLRWAQRSGRAWQSPAGPLVHERSGMMVSYRGAIALPWRLDLPPTGPSPCSTCDTQPCLAACPVSALSAVKGYDVDACHGWLEMDGECLGAGCQARRACPVSQSFPRLAEQSAFHMAAFHR
ncbi:MAG: ferredoxin [Pseudomonadota bacterium]